MPTQEAPGRLSRAQQEEIFTACAHLGSARERADYVEQTAQRLGVSPEDVLRAALDERRIRQRRKQAQPMTELAMAFLAEHALDAAAVLVETIRREATTDTQQRLRQAAATELMNRLGMAREKDEPRDAKIVITGMEPGMPPAQDLTGEEEEAMQETPDETAGGPSEEQSEEQSEEKEEMERG